MDNLDLPMNVDAFNEAFDLVDEDEFYRLTETGSAWEDLVAGCAGDEDLSFGL